jgi:hypothetical protein
MNEPIDTNPRLVEQQLVRWATEGAPDELRAVVLRRVRRELRAARWDRRLVRAAVVLLSLGVGMNLVVAGGQGVSPDRTAASPTAHEIGELAANLADATDVETASVFARRMASLGGWPERGEDLNTLEQEIRRRLSPATTSRKGG